jgi:Holliday junction resolvase RusA-like endonuclease
MATTVRCPYCKNSVENTEAERNAHRKLCTKENPLTLMQSMSEERFKEIDVKFSDGETMPTLLVNREPGKPTTIKELPKARIPERDNYDHLDSGDYQLRIHEEARDVSTNPKAVNAEIVFRVYGIPGEQGSKQARARGWVDKHTGQIRTKAWVQENNDLKNKSWREAVRQEALKAMHDYREFQFPLINCAVVLSVTFTIKKPGNAPKRRRILPIKRPDNSKLIRSTEDALTDAGFWKDDSQAMYDRLWKAFPNEDVDALESPGVLIRARIVPDVGY